MKANVLRDLNLRELLARFLINIKLLRPAETFVLLGLVFGLLFLVITPPMQVPDEVQHLYRTYQVSEFQFKSPKVDKGYGGTLPISVETVAPLLKGDLPGNDGKKVSFTSLKKISHIKLNPAAQQPIRFDNTTINSPIVYFPQAVGVGLGRVVHLNPFWLIYLGRLTNLIVWLALLYCAIRITPLGKWAFVVIALNPVSLSLAASLSPDAAQISGVALLVAVILRLRIHHKVLSTKYLVAFAALIIATSLLKSAYIPLIFAAFIVPSKVVSTRLKTLIVALALIVGLAWNLTILPMAKTIPAYFGFSPSINSSHQVNYLKHHPVTYVSTLASNIFGAPSSAPVPTYFGVFGWDDTLSPYWIQLLLFLTLVAALMYRDEKPSILERISKGTRTWLALLVVGSVVVLYSLLYTGYTPYAAAIIQGVQGRYFIPLTFLIVPIAVQSVVQLKVKQTVFPRLMFSALSFGLIAGLITTMVRFY